MQVFSLDQGKPRIFQSKSQLCKVTLVSLAIIVYLANLYSYLLSDRKSSSLEMLVVSGVLLGFALKAAFRKPPERIDLPKDVLIEIFLYLPSLNLLRCRAVCKRWMEAQKTEKLWERLYLKEFEPPMQIPKSWKAAYLMRSLGKWNYYLHFQKGKFEVLSTHPKKINYLTKLNHLIASSCEEKIEIIDLTDCKKNVTFSEPNVKVLQFSEIDKDVLFFGNEKGVDKLHIPCQKKMKLTKLDKAIRVPFIEIDMNGKGHYAFFEESNFYFVEKGPRKNGSVLNHDEKISCFYFNSDKNHLITGTLNGSVYLWDALMFTRLEKISGDGKKITSITASEKYFICGKESGEIEVWDIESLKMTNIFSGHHGPIVSLELSDTFLFSSSTDKNLKIWNLKSGKVRLRIEGTSTNGCFILGDGELIFSKDENVLKVDYNQEDLP